MRGRRLAVVVVALAVAGLTPACSGGGSQSFRATFDDVGDLVSGHSVQIADVRVGRITGISLTDDFRAEVSMSVDGDVKVPRATTAVLRTTSLLGEKFIELRPQGEAGAGPYLEDGATIDRTIEAPELEHITEQAVQVLGGVVSTDLAALIETGAVGFGGRGPELAALIDDLSVMLRTLADRTDTITRIIDRLGSAGSTLAEGTDELDGLLVNLAETTTILADDRDRLVTALAQLTRLARIQNEEVFAPHLADVDRQIKQLDAVLAEVVGSTAEVESLLRWLARFTEVVPAGVPDEFAQVYLWLVEEG